jgi:hypothetical protein
VITRIAILDELTPAVSAWLTDLNPASRRALMKGGRLVRRAALRNITAMFKRTGRQRTGTGMRGLKVRGDVQAGIATVRVWHGQGLLAAHELGSTIPPTTIRPRAKRVLGWGGTAAKHTEFSRVITRRGFTLRRRATLEPAYRANAETIIELMNTEYQTLLDTVPEPLRETMAP